MKILILCSGSKDSGAWLMTKDIARGLEINGNEVVLISPLMSKPFMLDYVFGIFTNFFKSLFIKCDLVYGIKPYPNVTVPMFFKKLFGAKTVIDIDDLDYGYRGGLFGKISKFVQRPLPRYFDLVTTHNKELVKHINSEFKVPLDKIYFREQGVNIDLLKPLGLPKDEKTIVYTAHLNIASDLDIIMDYFKQIKIKLDGVKFIVAGGGPMLDHYKGLAKSKDIDVEFTGYLEHSEIKNHIGKGRVCIVYYKDNFVNKFRASLKIREYLSMGCVVVANDVGELKRFSEIAYVVSSDNFVDECVRVLEKGDYKGKSLKARDYVVENFDWKKICSELGKKFEGLNENE